MGVAQILSQIDREIALFQRARTLLDGSGSKPPKSGAARPATTRVTKKKRNLTPEGRKRIAEAVRRRWAEQKKTTGSTKSASATK